MEGIPGQPASFSTQEAVDRLGCGPFQRRLFVVVGLTWIADAMESMLLAILSAALRCQWQLESWQEALITTVVFGGMFCSAPLLGSFADKFGRKMELILCLIYLVYFGFLSALSPSLIWLLITRGLVGITLGGTAQTVTLFAEFLPSTANGKGLILLAIFWALGSCLESVLALAVMPTLGWRYFMGFSILPIFLVLIVCSLWLPESPRFNVARGEMSKALATLETIAKVNGKTLPEGRLREPPGSSQSERGRFQDLFTKELRLTSVMLGAIWFLVGFSYFGVVLLSTAVFQTESDCHGGEGQTDGEMLCFLTCRVLSTADYVSLMWTAFAELPGVVFAALLVDRIGRKKTMALNFVVFSVFVILVNICASRPILTAMFFVARASIDGAYMAAYCYTPEVYPTVVRALGLGTFNGISRLGGLVTPFVAQVLLQSSSHLAISLYGVTGLLAAILSLLLPIETKGRPLSEADVKPGKLQENDALLQ